MKTNIFALLIIFSLSVPALVIGSEGDTMKTHHALNQRQQSIIPIAAFTADGDIERLKPALNKGLDNGLTVNEIKEVMVQLYAYAGFPRSLNALAAFMNVVDERKAKTCPLKDVTGLFRSFDYAAAAAGRAFFRGKEEKKEVVEKLGAEWVEAVRKACWEGYRSVPVPAEAPYLPSEESELNGLLDFFELEKTIYELHYEWNNRPDWMEIPIQGIARFLDKQNMKPEASDAAAS